MKEQFAQLRALQVLDSELKTLESKAIEIPDRVSQLKRSAETAKTELETTLQAITEHKKNYKLAEVELKAAEEKIASYSVQLYSARTNEQYKAFLKEIEAQKKIKSGIEDRMIVLMEEAEALERKRKSTDSDATELAHDTDRKVKALEAEGDELAAAVGTRRQRREELVQHIPSNLLKLYERIRKSKGGLAVVIANKDRCSGCLNPVPAQRVLEINRQDQIYTCEACGRILVTNSE